MKVKKIQLTRVAVKLSFAEALVISKYLQYFLENHPTPTHLANADHSTVASFAVKINPATKEPSK